MYLRRKFWLGLDTQDETDYFAPEGNKGFRYGSR
jgi:hypothetical protein